MDVINEIIQKSALSVMSKGYKNLVLLLFSSIVCLLLAMLMVLIIKGPDTIIQFGY